VAEPGDLLVVLAATPEGQAGIDQALQWLLPNRIRAIGISGWLHWAPPAWLFQMRLGQACDFGLFSRRH